MERHALLVSLALAVSACDMEPDCPAKDGYNLCGYCDKDVVTSSDPNAGLCTYCSGACTSACDPCGGGGGGGCDSSWVSKCHTVSGGIEFEGQAVPQSCGCPGGTSIGGVDNVSPGGPYYICMCN